MKNFALILLSGLFLLSGCARHYTITQNNGSRITATNKPKLVNGKYVFKDATGHETSLPAGRVTTIEPASESK